MIRVLLALQMQSAWTPVPQTVTVGDTVRLTRMVVAPQDVQARIEPLEDQQAVLQLSDPRASYAEGTLGIQYTVAAFAPGTLAVAMPDAELVFPDGRTELVPGDTAWIVVATVLTDSALQPRSIIGPIDRSETRAWPLVVLVLAVMGTTVAWGAARRRRRRRPPAPPPDSAMPTPPIDRWIAAGEGRAAAAYATDRVRELLVALVPQADRQLDTQTVIEVIAREGPDLPLPSIEAVLRDLDRARFAPASAGEFADVVDRAEQLFRDLCEVPGEGP